jgi:hypothetical protein
MGFGRDLRATPRTMEYQGQRVEFVDNGIRTTIRSGDRLAQILALTDGDHTFHLRSDNHGGSWTLIGIN